MFGRIFLNTFLIHNPSLDIEEKAIRIVIGQLVYFFVFGLQALVEMIHAILQGIT